MMIIWLRFEVLKSDRDNKSDIFYSKYFFYFHFPRVCFLDILVLLIAMYVDFVCLVTWFEKLFQFFQKISKLFLYNDPLWQGFKLNFLLNSS